MPLCYIVVLFGGSHAATGKVLSLRQTWWAGGPHLAREKTHRQLT